MFQDKYACVDIRLTCPVCHCGKKKKKNSCLSFKRFNKGLPVRIQSLWKHSMGTELSHTPIQCSVSVVCQLTCLLHNRAPTPRPNTPDKSMHALQHMNYLYTAPKTGMVKNTAPVNYSLRNIPKQEWRRGLTTHTWRAGMTVNMIHLQCSRFCPQWI